jgi:hypothetical protein
VSCSFNWKLIVCLLHSVMYSLSSKVISVTLGVDWVILQSNSVVRYPGLYDIGWFDDTLGVFGRGVEKEEIWRWFNVVSVNLPWTTEENWEFTNVADWSQVQFLGKWKPGWKGKCGIRWNFVVSRSERIVWRKAYPLCNRCMIPGHEWAEPTEQKNRLLPPADNSPSHRCPGRSEINCPILLLCSELGFYFTCTELVTNQVKKLIKEISN